MPTQILRRRGTAASHTTFVGGTGEITYITDTKALAIHDSSTSGGFPVHKFAATKTTLDANAIIFANSTTTLNTDTNLTWNGSTFSVTGAVTFDGDLTFTGAQTIQTSIGNLTLATAAGNGNVNINAHGTGDLAVFTNVLYVDQSAASVGVGVTLPESKLEVAIGDVSSIGVRSNVGLFISGGGSNGNVQQIGFGYRGGGLVNVPAAIGHIVTTETGNTKGALWFATRDVTTDTVPTERMRIDSAGNVGIGTTGPSTLLHVSGTSGGAFTALQRLTNTATSGNTNGGISFFDTDVTFANPFTTRIDTPDQAITSGDPINSQFMGYVGTSYQDYGGLTVLGVSNGVSGVNGVSIVGALGSASPTSNNAAIELYAQKLSGASGAALTTTEKVLTVSNFGTDIMTVTGAGNVGIGTTAPSTLLHVGLAGTTLGTIGLAGNTSGLVTLTVAAAAGTWTMKLPTGVGTAGYQLTDAAGDGITSWAAAASTRESKNILSQFSDSQSALNKILSTKVYNFKYKEGMGTGDHSTEYTGIMADEAPWAMHFNGGILNAVNTFGYTVLSIQALNEEIKELKEEILQLKNNKKTKP